MRYEIYRYATQPPRWPVHYTSGAARNVNWGLLSLPLPFSFLSPFSRIFYSLTFPFSFPTLFPCLLLYSFVRFLIQNKCTDIQFPLPFLRFRRLTWVQRYREKCLKIKVFVGVSFKAFSTLKSTQLWTRFFSTELSKFHSRAVYTTAQHESFY